MKISYQKFSGQYPATDALVVFATEENTRSKVSTQSDLEKEIIRKLDQRRKDKNWTPKLKSLLLFRDFGPEGNKNLLLVGAGKEESFSHESMRQAVAEAYRAISGEKPLKVVIDLRPFEALGLDDVTLAHTATEALLLASYSFTTLKSKKSETKKRPETQWLFITRSGSKDIQEGHRRGEIIAESTNLARWMGDMPGNLMTPTILAQETTKAARGTGLKVTVWDKVKIKRERMNSFLGVSLGSEEPPRFIVMEYKGAPASQKPICYVGKGLTFDTGGISIKPAAGMEEMKYDMCGGAAVIGTMLAIARLKLKINAIAYVPATDNMPGPFANKPGDIRVARNGVSIEVNNTDAEGRLILADALVYACEQKPKWICDAATLTGAMVIALGNTHSGYFTRSNDMSQKVEAAAQLSGELVWRMPVTDFHSEDMKGTYADLSNLSTSRGAGSATATAFLEYFVDKAIPYAHFDIAGTAWNAGNRFNYFPKKGATGAIIRTFVQLAIAEQ